MTPVFTVVGLLALLVGWHYFTYRLSGRPWWNPLWMAFTLTAVALVYGVAGLLGYDVPRHNPFINRPVVWVGHVVWAQVALASIMLLVSAPMWWFGVKRHQNPSEQGDRSFR
jgi:hypothetical protein